MNYLGKISASLAILFGVTAHEAAEAAPEKINDGMVNLHHDCADLDTVDGRMQCQKSFALVAQTLVATAEEIINAPRSFLYGWREGRRVLAMSRAEDPAAQNNYTIIRNACAGMESVPDNKKSERLHGPARQLIDGSLENLDLMASRAIICANSALHRDFALTGTAKHLQINAENVELRLQKSSWRATEVELISR